MDTRVQVTLQPDGTVTGKITGHEPYATVDELEKKLEEGDPDPGMMASADVAIAELSLTPEQKTQVVDALLMLRKASEKKLADRIGESKFEARRTARMRGEIKR